MYLDLVLNLSLLVALSIVSGFLDKHGLRHPRWRELLQGLLFGGAAVVGMLRPFTFLPGLIFDGRSVMLSLCALFFGPWAAATALTLTLACRIALGGIGVVPGVLVILASAGIGLWGHFRLKPQTHPPSTWQLYQIGLLVHLMMLALQFTLPDNAGAQVVTRIGLPVMLFYPLATILVGKILADQATSNLSVAALKDSERRFRSYVDYAPIAIFICDENGRYLQTNPAASAITGYRQEELLQMSIPDILEPKSRTESLRHFQEVVRSGRASGELPFRRKDGSLGHWVLEAVRLTPNRYIAFATDITERNRAEQALKESTALLAHSQQIAHLGSWKLDVRSNRLEWSDEVFRIFGCKPQEFGASYEAFLAFTHPDDRAAVDAAYSSSLQEKRDTYEIEHRIVRKATGEVRFVHERAIHERDEGGNIIRSIGMVQDITDRKKTDRIIRDSLREKESLLKEVHHRVKNNLQVITSLLRMEAHRSDHPTTKAVLQEMKSRILSMAVLHESLYRSGTFAAVDLGAYLKQLSSQSFRALATRPGAVRLHLDTAVVPVEMDEALPCGLLVNELISNCLKHGFPGEHTGEIRVELQPINGGPQVRLRVSDTGVGLPADFAARQESALGLKLASSLATQIGGNLEIGCPPGASFAVTFTPRRHELNLPDRWAKPAGAQALTAR